MSIILVINRTQKITATSKKPPKGKTLKKGYSSTRNASSTSMLKKQKFMKKNNLKLMKNPDIVKLAPFSTSLVSGKKPQNHSNLVSHGCHKTMGTGSCLKSIAERKTILNEIQNLSSALVTQQNKFALALERIRDERK